MAADAVSERGLRAAVGRVLALVVGVTAIVGALLAFKWLVFPAAQLVLRLNEPSGAIAGRLGSLVVLVLAYWAFVRFYENRSAKELSFEPGWIGLGAATGMLLVSLTIVPMFALGFYEVVAFQGSRNVPLVAATILSAAMLEEIVFRGLLFRIVEEQVGTMPSIAVLAGLRRRGSDLVSPNGHG